MLKSTTSIVGIVFVASIFVALSFSQALAAPDVKVGFVDIQRALSSSKAGAEAQKKYEAEVKKAQAKLDAKKDEFEKLQSEYEKQKESLSDKARAEREEKLLGLEKDLKRSFQDSQEGLRRENVKLLGELVKKIRKVVDGVGQEEGFTVILEKGGQTVLYADSQIDLTDRVIKDFDASGE